MFGKALLRPHSAPRSSCSRLPLCGEPPPPPRGAHGWALHVAPCQQARGPFFILKLSSDISLCLPPFSLSTFKPPPPPPTEYKEHHSRGKEPQRGFSPLFLSCGQNRNWTSITLGARGRIRNVHESLERDRAAVWGWGEGELSRGGGGQAPQGPLGLS